MSLEIPQLDDRTYEELRDDLLKRIPVYAPEWTDHNAHDPGITILELLAWLVETYGYQLDRITDDHRKQYLDLVGVQPQPPQPATVELSVAGTDDWYLPAHTPIDVETPEGEMLRFETRDDVVLTDAELAAVVSEHARGRTDHTRANETDGRAFRAFGEDATVGNALYLGFRGDPFGEADRLDLAVEFHEGAVPDSRDYETDPERFTPSLAVEWEWCRDPDRWYRATAWDPIETLWDETTAFYRGGRVVLAAPAAWDGTDEAAVILDREEPLVWLRAIVRPREDSVNGEGGAGDCESASAESAVETSTPGPERYELPPEFTAIRTNVVRARHANRVASAPLERIEDGPGERPAQPPTHTTGRRSQRFTFPSAPLLDAEVSVGDTAWTEVDDFAASGPDDPHYTLDRARGVVTFGDGRRGTIPQPDQPVVAHAVRYGGGPRGNVATGSTWTLGTDEAVTVTPLGRPTGGRAAETIPAAFERARERQRVPHRAVTAADHRELALRTPGVHVGRAAAIVDCEGDVATQPNEVTVVVVPYGPTGRRAIPTRGFLDAVEYQLCVHSLLTDRISVVPPTYVGVTVSAEVLAADGVPRAAVREAVVERLESFIDPLEGYDGDGWPFDRPVHRSDVFDVLERLPAVEDAVDVRIATGDEGDLETDQTTLPYLANVSVTVREEREQCGRGL